jgi:hypothetical protein
MYDFVDHSRLNSMRSLKKCSSMTRHQERVYLHYKHYAEIIIYLYSTTEEKISCINTSPQGRTNVATDTQDIIETAFTRVFRSYLFI